MAEPAKLGRYEIRQTLGRGAMGVVYEGFDPNLGRRVAIKTILQGATGDPEVAKDFAMRFSREARAAARLSHPNIVQVYDFGTEDGLSYLVMEFVEGTELSAFFDGNEVFELEDVTRLMTQLLAALDLAHNAGIVHRDIKPANLMVDKDGQAKLADFGVARVSDGQDATQVGAMVGTPAYMSPEQVQGLTVDRRSDIFSAGVILYQFLTGQKPFQGGGAYTLARKIIHDEPPTPSSLVPAVSPAYDRVIAKALAKNPEARYQTAREFSQALERLLQQGKAAEPDDDSTRKISASEMPTRAAVPEPAEAAPSTTDIELEFWRAIKESDDIDDLELYIAKFPSGVYTELAQRKVAKLKRAAGAAAEESENLKRALEQEARARREAEASARRAAEEKARLEADLQRAAQLKREAEAEAAARRQAEARARAAAPAQRASAPQPAAAPGPIAAPQSEQQAGPAKKSPMAVPVAIAALVVAGVGGAYFAMPPKATPEVAAPVPVAPGVAAPAPVPATAEPRQELVPPAVAPITPVVEEKKAPDRPKAEVAKAAPAAAPAAKQGVSRAEQEAAAKAAAEIAAAKAAADAAVAKAGAAAAAAEQRAAAAEAAAKAATDKAAAEQRAAAEKAAAEKASADKAAAEKAALAKVPASAVDTASADRAAAEKAAWRARRAKELEWPPSGLQRGPRSKAQIDDIIRQEEEAIARKGGSYPPAAAPSAPAAAASGGANRGDCSSPLARARNLNC